MTIEQQNETIEATTPAASTDPSRDDLIAAVREAGGTESVDVAAEEQAAAERAGAETAQTAEQTPAAEEPRIDRILKDREKAHAEREAARNHAQEMLEQARREHERLLAEAREKAQREFEAELERRRAALRASPIEQVRALGDPKEIADLIMREGTPEARAQRAQEERLAKVEQVASEATKAKAEIEALRKQLAEETQARAMADAQDRFVNQFATAEKAPYMHAEYGSPAAVFQAAHQKALEWNKQGLELGRDFDMNDIAQYVERETRDRFMAKAKALGLVPAQQASAGAPAKEPGNAPKASANGPRTLSAAQGSERRTSPRPFTEMKPNEQRAALIEEAAAARRANPDAVF
jgi:DNA repair exonuclease SbcCD ATPase subunit